MTDYSSWDVHLLGRESHQPKWRNEQVDSEESVNFWRGVAFTLLFEVVAAGMVAAAIWVLE